MSISSPLLPSTGVTTSFGCSLLASPPSCAFDGGNAAQLMVVAANATVSAVGLSFQARPLASTLCAGFGTRPLSVARLAALCGVTHARFVEQNGRSGGAGGAVTVFGSFTARACAFDGDAAPVGGAVLVQRAASTETAVATLVSDVFSSDVADGGSGSGGAVDAEVGSLLTVVNSTFRNDLGVSGGACEEATQRALLQRALTCAIHARVSSFRQVLCMNTTALRTSRETRSRTTRPSSAARLGPSSAHRSVRRPCSVC